MHVAASQYQRNIELIASASSVLFVFVDTTYINPEILYTIPASLFSAEPDLLVTSLIPARTIHHIFEGTVPVNKSPANVDLLLK